MQGTKQYTVDLTKVKGMGEIKCPNCGVRISPDDKTEHIYTILKSIMREEHLEKIVLQCNSCGSQIHLTGFCLLKK